jgi:hypothetical protein
MADAHHLVGASLKFVGRPVERDDEAFLPQACSDRFNITRLLTSQSDQGKNADFARDPAQLEDRFSVKRFA